MVEQLVCGLEDHKTRATLYVVSLEEDPATTAYHPRKSRVNARRGESVCRAKDRGF
jgi:hypothetical protein